LIQADKFHPVGSQQATIVPATSNRDFVNLSVKDRHFADHINITRLTFIHAENGANRSLCDH
jgi:hypothetical protein